MKTKKLRRILTASLLLVCIAFTMTASAKYYKLSTNFDANVVSIIRYYFGYQAGTLGENQGQTFTADFDGYYLIQVWGADGGSGYGDGGLGGYVVGQIYLEADDYLNIYVGSQGIAGTGDTGFILPNYDGTAGPGGADSNAANPAYTQAGSGSYQSILGQKLHGGSGGGGGTEIYLNTNYARFVSAAGVSLGIENRLMVAGGGGGGGGKGTDGSGDRTMNGGNAGRGLASDGINVFNGAAGERGVSRANGGGGGSTTGGTGGDATTDARKGDAGGQSFGGSGGGNGGGGGSGYYGGGGGGGNGALSPGGGGGGSSFASAGVSAVSGYAAQFLLGHNTGSDAAFETARNSLSSHAPATVPYATGNGYVVITYIGPVLPA